MHYTYELYLSDGGGPARFEPLTCPRDTDVIGVVRDIIAERRLKTVEVHRLGKYLFTVAADAPT
ncbi:MAG TPA: hypothetical protein VMT68_17015 [Caulobacteraceae bacterium]|nr:hypothetical protein [Caulobacteraceae bacterium]